MTKSKEEAMSDEKKYWDKEAVYDEQISPLMAQIIAICKEHEMPIVASIQYCDTEENGAGFCTTTITNYPHAAPRMNRINAAMQPERPLAFAETTITNPDGSKMISIRRV